MGSYAFEGVSPTVDASAFIAPTASLVGDVTVEAGASVWYGAVVRADYAPVVIRRGANVQDGAVLHTSPGNPIEVGPGATVAHNVVLHGATVEEEAMVANGATVLDGARIGRRALVAANSLVGANVEIPEGMLAAGSPAGVKRSLEGTSAAQLVELNPGAYQELAARHRDSISEVA